MRPCRGGAAVARFASICLLVACPQPAGAASAVAVGTTNSSYAYTYNQPNEEAATSAALRSCEKRANAPCKVLVSCDDPGYGAISFRRIAGRGTLAIGASCGAATVQAAYQKAVNECNKSGTGRCGHPRVGWHDRAGARPEEAADE